MKRLLIVEDDKNFRKGICFSLRHIFEIIEAEDAREGLDHFIQKSPDVVVTDLSLGNHVGGIYVLREISNLKKKEPDRYGNTRTLLITGSQKDDPRVIEASCFATEGTLFKPFKTETLVRTIGRYS